MTVYVDNARIPATVGRHRARWSHLTADTEDELHGFAGWLGLDKRWYQRQCKYAGCRPCHHWHYDVTDNVREQAIAAGAQAIDIRAFGDLLRARREAIRGTT